MEKKKWSQNVTKNSNALKLEPEVFTWDNPKKIALSLLLSAKNSKSKKSNIFKSAMSMLVFYINRAGKKLSNKRKCILEQTKIEMRNIKEQAIKNYNKKCHKVL